MRTLDVVVLAAYALLMLGVGAYYSWRNKTADDFLLGGRRMSPFALGLSLFATLMSTLSYLGVPGEMVAHGPMMTLQLLAHPFIFVIVGYGLIPLLMKQPVTSAYELLESRLGMGVRQGAAGMFLLLRLGWMATILFATSKYVLIPMLNLDANQADPDRGTIALLCVLLGLITATYSSFGGIKAVVMTDAIQAITMLTGAILTIAVITVRMGGVGAWWPDAWPSHWQTPNWGYSTEARAPFLILVMSTTLWYVCTNGSDQMSIQRFLSTRDAATARKTMLIAQLSDGCVQLLLACAGVAILGFYLAHPELRAAGETFEKGGDKLFPRFIMHEMPPGASGLVLAAILSAALSSLSSGVNSCCAVLERDFINPRGAGSDSSGMGRLKLLTWIVAAASVAASMLNLLFEGNLIDRCFKLINLLTAPLFVLFFLALFVRRANALGAWLGLATSTATAVVIGYGQQLNVVLGEGTVPAQIFPEVSFVWIIPCSLLVGISVGTLVSVATSSAPPDRPEAPTPA